MKTLSIGLTSGIGCGKTLISNVFSHLGVPVFNTDERAKDLYNREDVLKDMQAMFGTEIVENNKLNKQKLANIVFNNKEKLRQLNSYIHPKVKQEYKEWMSCQSRFCIPYVIMESALIFETNWQKMFDKIICINTPSNLAIERTIIRDNTTKEQVLERIKNQLPLEQKIAESDYIINNDNIQLVLPQIIKIDKQIRILSQTL